MVELLERHKELFSGIGATAFALVVGFVVWFGKVVLKRLGSAPAPPLVTRNAPTVPIGQVQEVQQPATPDETPPPFDTRTYLTCPLPMEIQKQIEQAPLFHRHTRSQEHVGRKVQWKTTLISLSPVSNDPKRVRLNLDHSSHFKPPLLLATVEIDVYPKLRDAMHGTTIWIAGEIAKCGDDLIEVGEARIAIEL